MTDEKMRPHSGGCTGAADRDLTPDHAGSLAERVEYFAALAVAAMEHAPEAPACPEKLKARKRKPGKRREKKQRADARRAARAERRAAFEAQIARNAHANGDDFRAPPGTPPEVWRAVRAIVADTRGEVVRSHLSTLPLDVRERAQVLVNEYDPRDISTRYRVALLVGLSMLARATTSTRAPRVVSGFCCNALCALLRDPRTGRTLSRSRVFNRRINAPPIFSELKDLGLIHVEQPGLGARNVPRGRVYALNVYYVGGTPAEHREAMRRRARARAVERAQLAALASALLDAPPLESDHPRLRGGALEPAGASMGPGTATQRRAHASATDNAIASIAWPDPRPDD